MRTSNPVFQVLPTFGNQALLAAGQPISALHHGQLGVFNVHTGVSVDGTVVGDCKDIYFAVGINRTTPVATALLEDIVTSAGQMIQTKNSRAVLLKPPVAEIQKVIEISGFTALCNSPYSIKIEFRNQMSYEMNGYNQFAKTFSYWTSCCPQTDCGDCPTAGSASEVAFGLAADINNDPDHLVIASVSVMKMTSTITGTTTTAGNASITIGTTAYTIPIAAGLNPTQAAAAVATGINNTPGSPYTASSSGAALSVYPDNANTASTDTISGTIPGLTLPTSAAPVKTPVTDPTTLPVGAGGVLVITGVQQPRPPFNNGIPIKYYKQGTDFLVSLIEGLGLCNGVVTTTTNLQYPEGSGYDLQNQEYVAGGWNGKPGPYRQLTLNGGLGKTFELLVNATTVYTQTVIEYSMESIGGSDEYYSDLKTIIAVPNTDGTTNTSLGAFMTALFANRFANLADDYATVATFPATNTPVRDASKTYATDGIEYAL